MEKADEDKRQIIKSFIYPFLFVGIIWLVKLIEIVGNVSFAPYGIQPKDFEGLSGIIFAPFIHADYKHLINNSIPLLVLGAAMFYFYKEIAGRVIFMIWLTTGLCVWIAGRESYHIGASGLIYGLAAFLFFSGIFRRIIKLIAISLLTIFLYGSLIWGIFPIWPGISWESHLFGGISGLAFALVYLKEGPQQAPRVWDDDEDEDEETAPWNLALIEDLDTEINDSKHKQNDTEDISRKPEL